MCAEVLTSPPSRRRRLRIATWVVVLAWMLAMSPLSFWGLPTSSRDDLLFGGEPAWDASRYAGAVETVERRAPGSGADTDADPLTIDNRIVELTADQSQRAAILLRYRLYSRQPDEMITFRALQQMNPRGLDFDPKLYQYGGAYIYLIGALIGVTSILGITTLSGDVNVYLAEPELFAGFYMVARIVSLIFGGLTLIAAVKLARLAAGRTAGWWALALTASCPVFITMSLEAKPHMASTCMILWAVLLSLRFLARGGARVALRLGLLAGSAFGLVLTGLVAAAIVPVLATARQVDRRGRRHLMLSVAVAAAVYVMTNPYVPYNFLFNRAALTGNIANSTGMYDIGRIAEGMWRVGELLIESCGPAILLLGLVGTVQMVRFRPRETAVATAPGIVILLICIAIGAGKPAEYARFLLLPAVLISVAAAIAVQRVLLRSRAMGLSLGCVVVVSWLILPAGPTAYLRSFASDAWSGHETRLTAARYLRDNAADSDAVGVLQYQDPAPYGTPPIDFAHRRVLLLPAREPAAQDMDKLPQWLVACADDASAFDGAWWTTRYRLTVRYPSDDRRLSRIAWANKPVFIFRRNR